VPGSIADYCGYPEAKVWQCVTLDLSHVVRGEEQTWEIDREFLNTFVTLKLAARIFSTSTLLATLTHTLVAPFVPLVSV